MCLVSCSVFKELPHCPLEQCSMIIPSSPLSSQLLFYLFFAFFMLFFFFSLFYPFFAIFVLFIGTVRDKKYQSFLCKSLQIILLKIHFLTKSQFFIGICSNSPKTKKRENGKVLSMTRQRAWFTRRLFSPLMCLTSVFGMGTGVSTSPSPPDLFWRSFLQNWITLSTNSFFPTSLFFSCVMKPSTY